ncbi:MAG TPA: hypothetical protein VH595_04580 [Verrucomicrobiae bacterium]|jgi:CHAD domain-containing protein|nr:hypothetical protein [Verrucomicrobiae bacterium]
MRNVIHAANDHTSFTIGKHEFKYCSVAEKSDVDAAENNAKGHADWRAGQLREELAAAIAEVESRAVSRTNQIAGGKPDLAVVHELRAQIEQLRNQMETVLENVDDRVEIAQKKHSHQIRRDLEALGQQAASINESAKKSESVAEKLTSDPTRTPEVIDPQIDEIEVKLKVLEQEVERRFQNLEQKGRSGAELDQLRTQVETLMAERNPPPKKPTTVWQRLGWLLRG